MLVKRLPVGIYAVNCYLIADETSGEAAVIDPGGDTDDILELLRGLNLRLSAIINTHGHFDHIGADAALREATGAPLLIHADDAELLADAQYNYSHLVGNRINGLKPDRLLRDGDEIAVGGLTLTVIHTPGHTRGGICLLCGDHLFSGDTLFAGSVGRTDLYGGDMDALEQSLRAKLLPLPDRLIVHPGHGAETTMAAEKRGNRFLKQ